MTECKDLGPGNFCWIELATPDTDAARGFYAEVFGWTYEENSMGDDAELGMYVLISKDGKEVGGAYTLMAEQKAHGVPPHWLNYVQVPDAEAAAAKATELGGNVVFPVYDVMDKGRMAVIADPTGATFAVWEPKSHSGAGVFGEEGSVCWTELMTRDDDAAATFYAELFGWERQQQEMPGFVYNMMMLGAAPAAGIMKMDANFPAEVPSHWMTYFSVADAEETCERIKANGGNVCVPPTDIPSVGRFAVVNDPQGATFSIIKLAAQQDC